MRSSALALSAASIVCTISACGPTDDTEAPAPTESAFPALEERTIKEPDPKVWQIVRDGGLPVKLSESAQSAKACSDAFLKEVEYTGEQLKKLEAWIDEMKSNPARIEEITKERRAYDQEIAAQKYRRKSLCQTAEMGMLNVGTRVHLFETPDQCAPRMAKVRVLMGNHTDKIGCVPQENVEEFVASDE